MAEVVELKPGELLPDAGDFLVITPLDRIRVFEYFIDPSPSLRPKIEKRVPPGGPGYASLTTALKKAQVLANHHGVNTIYFQDIAVNVRPFGPVLI